MGYVFPDGATLNIKRESRTSDWSSIRGPSLHGRGESATHEYLTGWLSHDEDNDSYACIVVFDIQPERMKSCAQRLSGLYQIEMDNAHRISTPDGPESIVFWTPGRAGAVTADRGCLLLKSRNRWQVCDPAWIEKPLRLHIADQPHELTFSKGRSLPLQ